MLSYEEALTYLQSFGDDNPEVQDINPNDQDLVITKAQELMNRGAIDQNDPAAEKAQELSDLGEQAEDVQQGKTTASKKPFNLSKKAQSPASAPAQPNDPFGAEQSPEGLEQEQDYNQMEQQEEQVPVFNTHYELYQEIGQYADSDQPIQDMMQSSPTLFQALHGTEAAADALDRYFQENNEEQKLELAKIMYEGLPSIMQNQEPDTTDPNDGMKVPVKEKESGSMYYDYLNKVTNTIKKEAEKAAKQKKKQTSSKPFNLTKVSQHHTDSNTIMWGPQEKRFDPFYRQPVSDWHIIERNKGFGQDIDGVWNVDWEAIWRGTIMDKYSRPYKDTETGEWVGGYIQKRFEVDKNIPEENNLQLKPGEKRRPILPEYGNTEMRLQSMRSQEGEDGDLGRIYNDTSKPFNWHEATSKKMKKYQQGSSNEEYDYDEPDPEAEGALFDAEKEFEELPPEEQQRIEQEVEQDLAEMYETKNKWEASAREMGEHLLNEGFSPEDVEDPQLHDVMKSIQMTQQLTESNSRSFNMKRAKSKKKVTK